MEPITIAGLASLIGVITTALASRAYLHSPNGNKVVSYRVAPVGGGWYDWQRDTVTSGGQGGYAGALGVQIGKFQAKVDDLLQQLRSDRTWVRDYVYGLLREMWPPPPEPSPWLFERPWKDPRS
jgi:hypothetical protein